MNNSMEIKFKAIPENEVFARNVVASFILPLNPTVNEIDDIKTAVSEAVTNSIVHAFPDEIGQITLKVKYNKNKIKISVSDNGIGIQDIERAMTPFYTSKPQQERSGMGFTVMESFMDKLEVKNNAVGLTVDMSKELECVGV